jgi:hypothetical protein
MAADRALRPKREPVCAEAAGAAEAASTTRQRNESKYLFITKPLC